jgi:hypothetical protein
MDRSKWFDRAPLGDRANGLDCDNLCGFLKHNSAGPGHGSFEIRDEIARSIDVGHLHLPGIMSEA